MSHSEDSRFREVSDILEGNLLVDHTPRFRSVRLFVSCDPHDSVWEHRMIEHYVLGELRSYCESLGLHFHLVNLNYGASQKEENALDRMELKEICLKEIKLCQKYSIGPNFLSLLSHHYGWKALPRIIPESDFDLFYKTLSVDDRLAYKTMKKLYTQVKNTVPQAYCIDSSVLKSVSLKECEVLSRALRRCARLHFSGKDKSKVQMYVISTLEEEVIQGIFNCPGDPNKRCCWLKRTFTNLHTQKASDPAMRTFCDLTLEGAEVDQEAQKTLAHLKEARMTAKYTGLENTNIRDFPLKWVKGSGLDPLHDPAHSSYLQKAFASCLELLKAQIDTALEEYDASPGGDLYKEVVFHGHYCKERAKDFKIHQELLQKVQAYLNGPSQRPLVISGCHGYGKTTLMAASARYHKERNPSNNTCLVVRFLATSSQSQTIRRTLYSICQQIHSVYNGKQLDKGFLHNYQCVVSEFKRILRILPNKKRPLYLFLDAVDSLSKEDGAHGLYWLPGYLPPHVKVVISTESSCGCHTAARGLLQDVEGNVIQVPALDNLRAQNLLSLSLGENRHRLTQKQEEIVLQKLSDCPSPLYLSLLMNTLRRTSHLDNLLSLPSTVEEAVEEMFERIEAKCGKILTSKAVSLITISRSGLTESEIIDLLSTDNEVVEHVQEYCTVIPVDPEKRNTSLVPSILWSCLLHELFPLLEYHHGEGNTLTLIWRHSLLSEAAKRRYLKDQEIQRDVYTHLANYFGGKFSQQEENESGEDYNSSQDLSGVCSEVPCTEIEDPLEAQLAFQQRCLGDRKVPYLNQHLWMNDSTPNFRALMELPSALVGCGQVDVLRDLLCDLKWQMTVIEGFSSSDVVSEFNHIVPAVPPNRGVALDTFELRTIREALAMSSEMLSGSSEVLPQVLVGRLLSIVKDTSVTRPLIVALCEQALDKIDSDNVIPCENLPESPEGSLLAILEGHRDKVTSVVCKETENVNSKEKRLHLFSCSCDGTVRSWDLSTGGVTQTLLGHKGGVLCLDVRESCSHAVSGGEDGTIRMWDLGGGRLFKTMKGHRGPVSAVVFTTNGEKTISGSVDGTVKVWNSDLNSRFCGDLIYTINNDGVPVSVLVIVKGNTYFVCGDENGRLTFWNLISGEVLRSIVAHDGAISSVAVVRVEEDGGLKRRDSFNSVHVVSSSNDMKIKMFDLVSGRWLHTINCDSNVSSISSTSSFFISGSVTGSLRVWDAKSCSLKNELSRSKTHTMAVSSLCLAGDGWMTFTSDTEGKIRVWDLIPSTTCT